MRYARMIAIATGLVTSMGTLSVSAPSADAATATGSTRRPRRGQVVVFRIRTTDERPRGFFSTPYAAVVVQRRTGPRWVNVRGSRTYTGRRGTARIRLRFVSRQARVRARTVADTYAASNSAPIRIRRR